MSPLNIPFIAIPPGSELAAIRRSVVDNGVHAHIDKVNWADQYPDRRPAKAILAHDGTYIHIFFETTGPHLKAVVDTDQGPVSSDSCFEFFVSPDADSPRYWNFEFNAIGCINASHRTTRKNPTRLSAGLLDSILTLSSVGDAPFEEKDGVHTWSLFVAIPLALPGIRYDGAPVDIRANLYKCGSATSSPHYLSWAPILTYKPDFHRPEFFARMTLL